MNNTLLTHWLKKTRRFALPLLLFVFGVLLLFSGRGCDESDAQPSSSADTIFAPEVYTDRLEEKIEKLLSSIDGVSGVTVLLTLDSGSEFVYAENKSGSTVDYLIVEGEDGEETVLIREIYASVRGIAVVCVGGDSPAIQKTVSELLSSAFDIPLSKISVAGACRK